MEEAHKARIHTYQEQIYSLEEKSQRFQLQLQELQKTEDSELRDLEKQLQEKSSEVVRLETRLIEMN